MKMSAACETLFSSQCTMRADAHPATTTLTTINGGATLKQFENGETDDFANSSILEFLNQEQQCLDTDNNSEVDIESIFEEINRLSGDTDNLNVEDILKEAELLINKQSASVQMFTSRRTNGVNCGGGLMTTTTLHKTISSESTPREMKKGGSVDIIDKQKIPDLPTTTEEIDGKIENGHTSSLDEFHDADDNNEDDGDFDDVDDDDDDSEDTLDFNENNNLLTETVRIVPVKSMSSASIPSLSKRFSFDKSVMNSRRNSSAIRSQDNLCESPQNGLSNPLKNKQFSNKSTSPASPTHSMCSMSTSTSFTISRERNLENEIEMLHEKLKDTEERLQSLRLQHDSLSAAHRTLRDNQQQCTEDSERLKIDVQHLNECANILRSELQSARSDRTEALDLQKVLQKELDESRAEKKKATDQSERDTKTIQDLHRQCKEMERILMRKHPDSVSALIVAAKSPSNSIDENSASRRLLEQRIAQLEADAKDQDNKAQKILANVQSRFSSVQCKYEQHIGDLETQVLSLQQINAKLNETVSAQAVDLRIQRRDNLIANFTQTFDIPDKDQSETCTTATQTDFKAPAAKITTNKKSKSLPDSHNNNNGNGKDDAHLLATIRGMRIDLAIKEKAMQRLTRELDECKKTIKKLQKEKDALKAHDPRSASTTPSSSSSSTLKKQYDPNLYSEQSAADSIALKESANKIKLLEYDYNALHNKRLQDLKTLQAAHERELASCQETVRILQQRLSERDAAYEMQQKRRKVPVDYLALKAKVSSLEKRHTEREQRLHILVEALSKGRLNGALMDGLLNSKKNENNQC